MAKTQSPLESTTRTFGTTKGVLSYAEISDLLASKVAELLTQVFDASYAERPIDESLIQDFHFAIIGDLMPDIAGKWRKLPVMVGNWLPPEPYKVPLDIHEFIANLNERIKSARTPELQIETLAYAEGEFLHIHPFQDFNGRTCRVLLYELLRRFTLPYIELSVEKGSPKFKQYQNALAEYDNGRIQALIDFWYNRLETA